MRAACANLMRGAIEQIGLRVMQLAERCVGAHGLLRRNCCGAVDVTPQVVPAAVAAGLDGDAVHAHFLGLCGQGLPL